MRKFTKPRLLIVSNRLPVNLTIRKKKLYFNSSVGGLATGLSSFYKYYDSIWVGWPGIVQERIKDKLDEIKFKLKSEFNCYPIFLSRNEIENYHYGFCNKTIWPLFHYFSEYTVYNDEYWKIYQHVNSLFAEAIIEIAKPGDLIWIHDYHLMILPELLRKKLADPCIGFFLHIPFPSFETFRLLPWRKEILEGIIGGDVIGFHTYDYVRHFLSSVHRLLGIEHKFGNITIDYRIVKVDSFPMGIDYNKFFSACQKSEIQKEIGELKEKLKGRKLIFSIDRLDYTKGIPQRLEGFDLFLKRNPEFKDKIKFICVAVPSRTKLDYYQQLKSQVDELVGRINGEHGIVGWTPIIYFYRLLAFKELAALYCIADVALITPLRDGMNLISKEFIATKRDGKGVLILSETAGSARELGEAIQINPNDIKEIAIALEKALKLSEEEQIIKNRIMQRRLQRYNIIRWAEEFINNLKDIKKVQKSLFTKLLSSEKKEILLENCQKAKRRLFLLDYDGTLTPIVKTPQEAKPKPELLELLKNLSMNPKNTVIIISGRKKENLEAWFGTLNLNLVAEHGIWLKERGCEWKIVEALNTDWKEEIHPILELYLDRTPGAFIEDKDFSIAWHFRTADSEFGELRARELVDILRSMTSNLNLQVIEGKKVIEVKNSDINKGRVALKWLSSEDWDFVLGIGDDWTDEDMFSILPETAYSICVGLNPSQAHYNLRSPREVVQLLNEIIQLE